MTSSETGRLRFVRIQEMHLPDIMAIEREAYPEPWTEGMFRQEIHSGLSHFYVAFFEEVLVGYVGFWQAADEAHITSVTVHRDYRKRAFAREELTFILEQAAALGLTKATLEVRASNLGAQQIYLKAGFQQVGRRKGYYTRTNEDAIVMVKQLVNSE